MKCTRKGLHRCLTVLLVAGFAWAAPLLAQVEIEQKGGGGGGGGLNTTLTSTPPNPSYLPGAGFAFTCTQPPCEFRCRLDGLAEFPCDSGSTGFAGLADGSHQFEVYARKGGTQDYTPATYSWVVDLPEVSLSCSPFELTVQNRGKPAEVFVRAANTEPEDYNEYQFDLAAFQSLSPNMSTFNHLGTGVVALQVTVREPLNPLLEPPLVVREFRCPVVPAWEDVLSVAAEQTVRAELAGNPDDGEDGLNVGAAGSPIGNRDCLGNLFPFEISAAFFQNFTPQDVRGILHTKYTCSEKASNFDAHPAACCTTASEGAEGCCEGIDAPGECVFTPSPIASAEAIESSYRFAVLDAWECVGNNIKASPQLAEDNGNKHKQGKFSECCDADDAGHLNMGHATCAGMVVTHAMENGNLKELREPFWTRYAMDSEKGQSLSPPTQVYVDAGFLKFDCLDFTVADVPVTTEVSSPDTCTFNFVDLNGNGVFDDCD